MYVPAGEGFSVIADDEHVWQSGAYSNDNITTNANAITILNVPLLKDDIIGMESFGDYEFTVYNSSGQNIQYYTHAPYTITSDGNYSIMIVTTPRKNISDKVSEIKNSFGILNAQMPGRIANQKVYMSSLNDELLKYISPLFNKKIVFLGDSLFAGYTLPKTVTWCNKVGEKYNMEYYNYGINSNPIAVTAGDTSGLDPMCVRYTTMEDNADYIVVEGGANDRAFSVPLGTEDSNDTSTFMGALNVLITGLLAKYPRGKVVFMTPYYRLGNNTPNGANLYEKDYVDAMLKICANHSVPCFDNYHDSGISWLNTEQVKWMDQGYVASGTINYHFSPEAYTWMMPMYEALLNRL